jgi:uncharacterized cupin superfamily protein
MRITYLKNDILISASKIENEYFDEVLKIGGKRSSFSEYFKFQRIGINYFEIPPGYRTSRPHAEKCEDEFIYVISGEIDCWFNGKIKRMKSGDSIGFPAGTGVGHSFINNSVSVAELFVAGERTKSENQYHFHLEPQLQIECKERWWRDMPAQSLAGHNGLPGEFDKSLFDQSIKTLNGLSLCQDGKTYSYPGDSETFGHGTCLSREFQINSFAVWIEKLPPGKRSAWPHAHSVEEEFIFVLEGKPTLWINHKEFELKIFDGVDFKAGSGLAHAILNKSDRDLYYLCVGECNPFNDLIYYPLHDRRNEEMKVKGLFWEDVPQADIE